MTSGPLRRALDQKPHERTDCWRARADAFVVFEYTYASLHPWPAMQGFTTQRRRIIVETMQPTNLAPRRRRLHRTGRILLLATHRDVVLAQCGTHHRRTSSRAETRSRSGASAARVPGNRAVADCPSMLAATETGSVPGGRRAPPCFAARVQRRRALGLSRA